MSNHSNPPDENEEFCAPFTALSTFLDEKEIKYAKHPKKKLISFSMVGDYAVKRCTLQITHDDSLFQLLINYPVYAKPETTRTPVAEFVTRANYGLALGKFEMDLNDGEVRFHCSQIIHDGHLPDEIIGKIFFSCLKTTERYYPALMQLLFGGHTPADAVYMAELDLTVESREYDTPEKKSVSPQSGAKSNPSKKPRKQNPVQPPIAPPAPDVNPDQEEEDIESKDGI